MSAEQLITTALAFGAAFVFTLGLGKRILSRRSVTKTPSLPESTPVCVTRHEEITAWSVLAQARQVFPDLDLELLKKQVHP